METTLYHQRLKGLFDGLYKSRFPFAYILTVRPVTGTEPNGDSFSLERRKSVFEYDTLILTWSDCKTEEFEGTVKRVENQVNILNASFTVALPKCVVKRLEGRELSGAMSLLLLPGDSILITKADAQKLSLLSDFSSRSPSIDSIGGQPKFYLPNFGEAGSSGIKLGSALSEGEEYNEIYIQQEDLQHHVCILGMTGAGKSTTAQMLVDQVARHGLPLLVLDWHNEYRELVERLGGLTLAPGKDNFTLNPLDALYTTDLAEHIALVTDIFSDIYHFTHPQSFVFRTSLQRIFEKLDRALAPSTLSTLVQSVESYPMKSTYDNETRVALLRRLIPLTEGQAGKALNGSSTLKIDELLSRVVCVELGHFKDFETRSIFSSFLLKIIYDFRVSTQRRSLDHIILVEEARSLVPTRRVEDPPSIGEKMISELRKFGQGMIFVAQFPTQISSEIVKNAGVRIVHRVSWLEDVKLLKEALGLNEEQTKYLPSLSIGEAIVSIMRLNHPVLVRVNMDGRQFSSK